MTAEKREENLQNVPISVKAFTGAQLEAKGITNPKQLTLSTPGLEYNTFANYTIIYLRGVGTDAFIPSADASVATYIDGIYFPFGHGLAGALGSVKRIEVLKGPQGTLFGRNSTGGAINIITKQPDVDDGLHVHVLASRESYDDTKVRVFANIPLTDTVAISLSALRYQGDSYYSQAADSPVQKPPLEISQGFTGKIAWTPIEGLKAVLGYTYLNSRGSVAEVFPSQDIKPLGVALGVTARPDYTNGANLPIFGDNTTKVITADIKYHLPWFDLRAIGGDQNIKSPALIDFDGSTQPLIGFEASGQFAKVKTGELQVISNDSTWDWLKWIGGFYYIKESAGFDPLDLRVGDGLINFLANPTGPLGGLTSPLISTLQGAGVLSGILSGANADGVALAAQGVLDTRSESLYGQATADLTDWVSLTLGGRVQKETRTLAKSTASLILPDTGAETQIFDFGSQTTKTSNFSPKAVLDFNITDGQHAYVSYSKGFKSGTYNIINLYTPTQYIPPEVVTSYEVGYKSELFDGTVRLNGAIFQNKTKNLQVQNVSLLSGGATRFETAGSARVQGAEYDLTWQVLPESLPGLVLTSGGSYLRGRYTDFTNGSGYDNTTGLFFGGQGLLLNGGGVTPGRNFTGNTTVRTPTFSGNLGLDYTFDIGDGTVDLDGSYYYNTGFYFSAQNVDRLKQDAYGVLDARVSYLYNPWKTRITVFGQNITRTKYYYGELDLDFSSPKILAPPGIFGVRLEWDF